MGVIGKFRSCNAHQGVGTSWLLHNDSCHLWRYRDSDSHVVSIENKRVGESQLKFYSNEQTKFSPAISPTRSFAHSLTHSLTHSLSHSQTRMDLNNQSNCTDRGKLKSLQQTVISSSFSISVACGQLWRRNGTCAVEGYVDSWLKCDRNVCWSHTLLSCIGLWL